MQQGPPPITPPGLSPVMMGSVGMGAQYGTAYQSSQQYQNMGAGVAAARVGDFVGNTMTPALVHGGSAAAMLLAPIMAGQGGLVGAVGKAANFADPMSHMGSFYRFGFGFARGGAAMKALRGARGASAIARALPAVLGAGAMGVAAAAIPVAAGLAATEGVIRLGTEVAQGAQERFTGQALMQTVGAQFGASPHSGANIGQMLGDMGREVGKNVSGMADMVREMDQMKLFQTTRSVKEFKERMTQIMDTVKEVATTMQTSVDDALKMVGEMRTQGFYTSSDIKAATLRQQARSSASGLSTGQMIQAGRFGTQYARALGMRGRFGSNFAQQQTASVSYALRQGLMSEEDIMEAGGVEQVGASLAATQMRFLRTSRGRMMIANMIGGGTEMDMGRIDRMLSGGMTLESMVTGAAGRGLGTLTRAGLSEARENAMPYAGMGMVSIAAAQSQQLYGGYNQNGILRMLGTMGVGRRDARLLLQQTMAMPGMLQAEDEAAYTVAQRAAYSEEAAYHSLGAGVSRYLNARDRRHFGRGLFREARGVGRTIGTFAENTYRATARLFGSPVEYSGGGDIDRRLANEFAARTAPGRRPRTGFYAYTGSMFGEEVGDVLRTPGPFLEEQAARVRDFEVMGFTPVVTAYPGAALTMGFSNLSTTMDYLARGIGTADYESTGRLRGPPGARERIRTEFSGYTVGPAEAAGLRDEGTAIMNLGAGRFITEEALKRAQAVERRAGNVTDRQSRNLKFLTTGEDDAVLRARKVLEGTEYAVGDADLEGDARKAYELAAAADILGGVAGTSEGLLGPRMRASDYAGDSKDAQDARLALQVRLSKDASVSEYLKRRTGGSKTVSGAKEDFSESMDTILNDLGVGTRFFGKGDSLRKQLVRDEATRGVFSQIMRAYGMADGREKVEALQQALAEADALGGDAGPALVELINNAKSDKALGGVLKEKSGEALLALQEYGYYAHRGRSASRVTGVVKSLFKRGKLDDIGGQHEDALRRLMGTADDPTRFGRGVESLGKSILSDSEIDASEAEMLKQVFGGAGVGFQQAFRGLMEGDKDAISSLGLDLDSKKLMRMSKEDRASAISKALEQAGMLDITGFAAAGGKEVNDLNAEYIQTNTRFVAAVNQFVGNLKQAGVGGDEVWNNDYSGLDPFGESGY